MLVGGADAQVVDGSDVVVVLVGVVEVAVVLVGGVVVPVVDVVLVVVVPVGDVALVVGVVDSVAVELSAGPLVPVVTNPPTVAVVRSDTY